MPVNGFPTILENILNNMLQESQLASYKLAGNQQRTTQYLRFDAMADTSVSTYHLSTPAEVRRKSPSQLRRDRRRIRERYLLSKEDVPVCLNRIESKTKQTPMIDKTKITKPSELDLGLTLFRSDRPSQQELCVSPKYTLPQQPLNAASLPTPTNAKDSIDCYKLDTPMLALNSPENNKQGHAKLFEKVNAAPPDQELGPKKPESKFENANAACVSSSSELKFRARSRSRSSPSHTNRSSSESSACSSADGQVTSDQVETVSKKENHSAASNYLLCDKVQLQIINKNEATRKKIAQPERSNTFKKLLLDTFEDTCSIVVETEDLIVEYCIRKEQIINFFTIEDKEITLYKRMLKRHIKDWPDDTHRIKEEAGPEVPDNFLTELQLLNYLIQEEAARHCG
ncbi:hypothetical protein ElyMa_006190800 [Elysia marginata]|uniref:Uncharacterized protein n=1 Tax=Elysia marginata TaxID=1093978 RepID=A0AAV4H1Z5_9GAST|nr:hypothetical protein ElyMa_006190800 [Elysia marginata]